MMRNYSTSRSVEVIIFRYYMLVKSSQLVMRYKKLFVSTPEIYLSDLHDENVIRSKEGNVFVVDCDIRINTPKLRCGGKR